MRNWKAIAEGHGLDQTASDLDRVAGALSALEETFRPLAERLSPDQEPDTELRLDGEGQ